MKFRELRRAQDGRLQGEVEWARLATASEVRRAMRAGEAQTPADEAKAFRDCARQRAIEEIGTPGVRAGLFSSFTGTVAVGLATYAALLVWEVSQGADIAQSLEAFGGGALVVGIAVALNVAATASRKERVRERVERLCADPHGDGTAADIADCARNVAFARALGEDGDIRGFGGDYDLRGEGLRVVIVPDQFGAKANHVRVASETPLVVDAIDLDAFSDGYTRTPSNTRNLHHNTVVMDL
ncbi:hypothetical protein CKO28_14350 [Rhodovibrio sodomensis]|uniref:Uncharacterized protein n=1 Tax=Rhodovibrio sodomensis TaxID=1088 RepID=A0ABS1DIK4_9PROT|nr:hypothetical protein [Rhodovibrio sodomensis]